MQDTEIGRAISLAGLGTQVGMSALLAFLFAVLSRAGSPRNYFTAWSRAWFALLVGLLALSGAFILSSPPVLVEALFLVYQAGKVLHFLLLAVGAWLFLAGPEARSPGRLLIVPVLVVLGLGAAHPADPTWLIALQGVIAVPALGGAAWMMAAVPPPRRAAPSVTAASTFAATALLWGLYLYLFISRALDLPLPGWRGSITTYNSYFDLLLETLLAFAMVLLRAQDAQSELISAHDALGQAHDRLREQSLLDPLTGALNRRAFDEGVGLALAGGGTVVAADVDGLKSVNDSFGHAAGDALLRHFATEMKGRLRDRDRLYRVGGDEFVVVAPGAEVDRMTSRMEQALASLPDLPASGDRPALPVRASWGAATFTTEAGLASALDAADARMYERKRSARPADPA
jgi:diguanylate cyclase (GGDEF)-like protein